MPDRSLQMNPLKRSAAAQRDIGLTVSKCAVPQVDNDLIECFSLALMDRNGPCQFNRILSKRTGNHRFDPSLFPVIFVFDFFPDEWLNLAGRTARKRHLDQIV